MIRALRPAGLLAVAVVCVTGCTSGAAPRAAGRTTSPSPSSTPTAPATPTQAATVQVAVGPLQLAVPRGWSSGGAAGQFGHLCVAPPGARRPAMFGCAGLDVWYGWDGYLPGNEQAGFERAHPGWYHATDVQPCPVKPTDGPDKLNGVRDDGLTASETLRPVGNRSAYFYQWHAHCDDGYRFAPRAWYLPTSKVLVFDYVGDATAEAALSAATFDPGRWTFGFLHGATSTSSRTTVAFDEAEWLSGEAANDYARRHGMESPVPNDYLIVDPDTSTSPYPLAATARVVSVFRLAGTEPGTERTVSVSKLVAFVADRSNADVPFHVHLDPSGRIDQVVEQYRP